MKNKILGIILIITVIMLLPIIVFGYENKDNVKLNDITYQLFEDGTAKIKKVEDNDLGEIIIYDEIHYNNEDYKITEISSNTFDGLTKEHELQMFFDESPKLEVGAAFQKISAIYIPLNSKEYTQENGWPVEKLKNYKITKQPQDITVTAGEIKETDALETVAHVPALTAGTSIIYNWYECDKDGNITNNNEVSSYHTLKIPTDLSYNNNSNTPKKYYYVGVIGSQNEILEKTRVVEVTVNPGIYKVYFNGGAFAEWETGETNNSIIIPVNNRRKIENSNIPSTNNLKPFGKGFTFVGWSLDEENVINPTTITYEKNTTLYPVWKYKVSFDANGGKFSTESEALEFTTSPYDFDFYDDIMNMKNPTREGYEFLGFFDKLEDGKSLDYYLNEDGIYEQMTFYARWKEVSNNQGGTAGEGIQAPTRTGAGSAGEIYNSQETGKTTSNNPQTGDNIILFIIILVVSITGIIVTTKIGKKFKK